MKPPKSSKPARPQNLNEECLLAYLSQGAIDIPVIAAGPAQPFDLSDMSAGGIIKAPRVTLPERIKPNTLI